jgi:hypothetical protein
VADAVRKGVYDFDQALMLRVDFGNSGLKRLIPNDFFIHSLRLLGLEMETFISPYLRALSGKRGNSRQITEESEALDFQSGFCPAMVKAPGG